MKHVDLHSDTAVIVPAYNEEATITQTLDELVKHFSNVYLVDDGSTDLTGEISNSYNIKLIKHALNLGQGAALQSGFDAALLNTEVEFFLTYDADGQHSVKDAIAMLDVMRQHRVDVILGSRFCSGGSAKNISLKKKLILNLAVAFTRFDSGLKVSDTHNGLRILRRSFVESLNIRQSGMAHASEILNHVRNVKADWIEFPVQINYTEYSKKKGQSILNSVNILTELLYK